MEDIIIDIVLFKEKVVDILEKVNKDYQLGNSLPKASIPVNVPDTSATEFKDRFEYFAKNEVLPGDALMLAQRSELGAYGAGPAATGDEGRKPYIIIQIITAFLIIRGAYPKRDATKLPKIIAALLLAGGFSKTVNRQKVAYTDESDLAALWCKTVCIIPPAALIPEKLMFQKEIIQRIKLNAAGHKIVHLSHKYMNCLTEHNKAASVDQATKIIKAISAKYSREKVYLSLLPFSRGPSIPTGRFFEQFLNLLATGLSGVGLTYDADFSKYIEANEIRPAQLEFLKNKDKTVPSWGTWNPSSWEDKEILI